MTKSTPFNTGGLVGKKKVYGESGIFNLTANYNSKSITRRKLISTSGDANTGMHSTNDILGRPTENITVAYWWKTNSYASAGGDNPTFWAGNAGDYKIYYLSGGVSARIDGTDTYNTTLDINTTVGAGEWVFVLHQMGKDHSGTNDVFTQAYYANGTSIGSDTVTTYPNASSTEITTNGTHWLLGDDSTGDNTDNGIIAEIFDFCLFDGIIDVSDLQIDTANGGWKDLTFTSRSALVYRLDGRNADNPGEDSSGSENHFTVESNGVTLSNVDLPDGAGVETPTDVPLTANGGYTGTEVSYTGYSGDHDVVLWGAGGGGGTASGPSPLRSDGGTGASVSGTITLETSDTIVFYVGEGGTGGTSGTTARTGGDSGIANTDTAGDSGSTTGANYRNSVGGSGGGATTLKLNGTIYAVAGGGGGGGSGDQSADSTGSDGGNAGAAGGTGNHGNAAQPGTQNAGGAGAGNNAGASSNPGSAGTAYNGGDGGSTNGANAGSGGGGGAGYYGGGGGASGQSGTTPSYGGGGAGGSSLVPAGWSLNNAGGGAGGAGGGSSTDGTDGTDGKFEISPV